MIAAGVRKFACGISPAANAKRVRKQSDGKVLVTDGPYLETKEHIGGFGYCPILPSLLLATPGSS
jgi:hypothetical protein